NRFNGMWAFAIHDKTLQVLFCSRDRYGVKPFYYLQRDDLFAFGSEIRELLPFLPSIRADIDVLKAYLITDAAELSDATFFQQIRKLPSGHNLIYDIASQRIRI